MNARTYPGKGLSLSQLTFALNEELKRTAYSTSFDFEKVSQLDQDISAALAIAREWRNSFIPINRIPLDILSLIPTYLTSQNDRLRASFVCRHWRRTLLQRAELWSQLFLSKGEAYVETLLERARGSTLDITVGYKDIVSQITPLSSRAGQIRCLEFQGATWANIQMFSEIISGPLSLLQALKIRTGFAEDPGPFTYIPLFSSAILKVFRFYSNLPSPPFLNRFHFPNLTFFHFYTNPSEIFSASQLLDFLEASPMLQTVHMQVDAAISLHQVLQRNTVVLPNLETFELVVSDGRPGYQMAAKISCPSARVVSLSHEIEFEDTIPEEIFPAPDLWQAIVSQYSRSPVEEASLNISTFPTLACQLSFLSPGPNAIELSFQGDDEDGEDFDHPLVGAVLEIRNRIFAQATRTVQNHPQLANLRRLYICHNNRSVDITGVPYLTTDVRRLFESMGSLDELVISRSDLRPYFYSFFEPVVFPKIKEFTVSHPVYSIPMEHKIAVVGFAIRQHALGIPLERVIICGGTLPTGMEEELRPWVGSVEHRYEELPDGP